MTGTGDTEGLFSQTAARLRNMLPELPSLDFKSDAEVAVYLVHYGPTAEDYEMLCDFDLFIAENQKGTFVRPKLKVWAGRNDFDRYEFARNLRAAFSDQFDTVRREVFAEKEKSWLGGDFSVWSIGLVAFQIGASLTSTLLLMLATSAGRAAVREVGDLLKGSLLGGALGGKSARARLEEKILEKQGVVDEGLARMEVALHRDLYVHAYRGQAPGSMSGIDFKAWPLPFFVTNRLRG